MRAHAPIFEGCGYGSKTLWAWISKWLKPRPPKYGSMHGIRKCTNKCIQSPVTATVSLPQPHEYLMILAPTSYKHPQVTPYGHQPYQNFSPSHFTHSCRSGCVKPTIPPRPVCYRKLPSTRNPSGLWSAPLGWHKSRQYPKVMDMMWTWCGN